MLELFTPVLAAAQTGEIPSLFSGAAVIALVTLAVLEIVLGIDNIIFIAVLADKLPKAQQNKARTLGLILAMVLRVLLLLCISWIMGLTAGVPGVGEWLKPVLAADPVTEETAPFSWRDLILLGGGLFLIWKATKEIHEKLEGDEHGKQVREGISFAGAIFQIIMLDIIFSLDSVITAVGMVQAKDHKTALTIMIAAVVIAVGVMLFAARPIANFVNRHPTVKMLAFSFLILVGVVLIVDSTHRHIPKGYIYFAMAFSVVVELLNLKLRAKGTPVQLHGPNLSEAPKA